jgi:hypothetical protein
MYIMLNNGFSAGSPDLVSVTPNFGNPFVLFGNGPFLNETPVSLRVVVTATAIRAKSHASGDLFGTGMTYIANGHCRILHANADSGSASIEAGVIIRIP